MYSIVLSGLNRSRYEFCIMESLPSILLVFPPILPYNILSLISLTIQLNSITQPIVLITYSRYLSTYSDRVNTNSGTKLPLLNL